MTTTLANPVVATLLRHVERIEAANRGHATAMSMLSNATPEQRRERAEAVEATRMGVLLETSLLLAAIKRMAVES